MPPREEPLRPASEDTLEPVTDLVSRARDAGASVIYTRDVHPPGRFEDAHYYDEFDRWGEHVVEGTWDAELHPDHDVREEDHIFEKHTYDDFHQTELEGYIDAHGVRDMFVCGTPVNVCVLHTTGGTGLRDYRPVLVEDAVGYIEEEHGEYALEHTDWLFSEVTTLDDVAFE